MKKSNLTIKNLVACVKNKKILKGIDLSIKSGEVHAIMGPNGAGKSTLALSVMGSSNYELGKEYDLRIDEKDLSKMTPDYRAKEGLFISFQQPIEVTGVTVLAFLRTAYKALHPNETIPLSTFKKEVKEALERVSLSEDFMKRFVNEGFSGGEKKRLEIAQMLILKPKFAILDEIDSGLDVDSLRIVARAVGEAVKKYCIGILLITHYQRILHYLKPDFVHVLIDGKIKKSDGMALVRRIEKDGYAAI